MNPSIAATAHERIFQMIRAAGWQPGLHAGETSYGFFAADLYGLDVPLERIVRYFETAAQGHETRRRILLLWGPPGGAKSSVAALLKRGLEAWTATEVGAVYTLQGCPMHEEPLHLIPAALRPQAREHTGIPIQGGLCPVCHWRLDNEFGGDFLRFPIERVFFSESRRIGIGTFEPGDPKSMSMEQLTGGLDFKAIETHGSDSHPLALDWAGEFSKSNRGVFEAVEFFKNPAEFRNLFLTMAQEKQFKVAKFGYIDSDTVIVAHTNEAEFRAFMADQKNEALKDRLVTVAVPYNVRVSDEEKIYRKLLTGEGRGDAAHRAARAARRLHGRGPLAAQGAREPRPRGEDEALRRRGGRRLEARADPRDQARRRPRGHERARPARDRRRAVRRRAPRGRGAPHGQVPHAGDGADRDDGVHRALGGAEGGARAAARLRRRRAQGDRPAAQGRGAQGVRAPRSPSTRRSCWRTT